MKTEEQERAARWVAENVDKLPENVGELVAILTLYASQQPVTVEVIDEMFPFEADRFMWAASESYNNAQKHRREGAKAIATLYNDNQ